MMAGRVVDYGWWNSWGLKKSGVVVEPLGYFRGA